MRNARGIATYRGQSIVNEGLQIKIQKKGNDVSKSKIKLKENIYNSYKGLHKINK